MPAPQVRSVPRRPIDKELKVVNKTLVATTQASTTLKTTTFPCTVTGLRWSFDYMGATTSAGAFYWAIVHVQDGDAANSISGSDGADFYTPEQNVLAFGAGRCTDLDAGTGNARKAFDGTTKTMRKMKQGDQLLFIAYSEVAGNVDGVIQFFCKS